MILLHLQENIEFISKAHKGHHDLPLAHVPASPSFILTLPPHTSVSCMTCHFQPIPDASTFCIFSKVSLGQEDLSLTYYCLIKYYASFNPQFNKPKLRTLLRTISVPYIYLYYSITKSLYLFTYLFLLVVLKYNSFCIHTK